MAESNTNNSVRDRINLIVDAQEAKEKPVLVVPEKPVVTQGVKAPENKVQQNKPEKKRKSHLPVVLACVFGVIVIGLIIAVVVVKMWPQAVSEESADLAEVIDSIAPATDASQTIILNTENDPNYSNDDAILDFEELMEKSSGVGKVYVAFYYSSFVFNSYNDSTRAISILESVEELVDEDSKIAYEYYLNGYKNGKDENQNEE